MEEDNDDDDNDDDDALPVNITLNSINRLVFIMGILFTVM
jgi:hypothetical protein